MMFLNLPGMDVIRSWIFMDHVPSSLSENESSAEGVHAVFVALQVNPSLQKLE